MATVGKDRPTSVIAFPLGPYHPALAQPVALTLRLRDEKIVSVATPGVGYSRRGVVGLVEGQPIADALVLVERSCAQAGAAHRLALCMAIEAAAQVQAPLCGRLARTLTVEVARALARLWSLGQIARATELPSVWREALDQREHLFAAMEQATGSRVYWAVAQVGGARADLNLTAISDALRELAPAVEAWRVADSATGPLGRALASVGALPVERTRTLQGMASAGRSGEDDLRRAQPYDGYADAPIAWPKNDTTTRTVDVAERARYAVRDLALSLDLARACLDALDAATGAYATPVSPCDGEGRATVEGPHGPVTVEIALSARGRIELLRLLTPCAPVVAALPDLLTGSAIAQTPATLASLDLCLECVDL